jgi:hypothetical protein
VWVVSWGMTEKSPLTPHQLRAQKLYALLMEAGAQTDFLASTVGCQLASEGIKAKGVARTLNRSNGTQLCVECLLIDGHLVREAEVFLNWEACRHGLSAQEGPVEWGAMNTTFDPQDPTWLGNQSLPAFRAQCELLAVLITRDLLASGTSVDQSPRRPGARL